MGFNERFRNQSRAGERDRVLLGLGIYLFGLNDATRKLFRAKLGFPLFYIFPGGASGLLSGPQNLCQFLTASFSNDLCYRDPMRLPNAITSSFITYT